MISAACCAQGALTLSPPTNPRAGTNATWTITLSGGTAPAALQWNFSCDHALGTVATVASGTAVAAGKTATALANGNTVLTAFNQTAIADGIVATVTAALPAALANVNLICNISSPTFLTLGATPAGTSLVETPNPPVSVSILPAINFCDVNGDGLINTTDVTAERTSVLNQTAADRNGDGKTDIVDLQIVTNAAIGGGCTATQ